MPYINEMNWWQYILLVIYLFVVIFFLTIQIYQTLETLRLVPDGKLFANIFK